MHVDFSAWAEMALAGVDENNILRFVNRCDVPTWILPIAAPFTMLSMHTNRPILADDFR
jgi:hypothetical protein